MGTPTGNPGNFGRAAGTRFLIDERDVGGGTSHIESDDAVEPAAAGAGRGPYYASGRSGENGAYGFAGGG